jgi:hypothetical protein
VGRIEEAAEVSIDVAAETLEMSEPVKNVSGYYQDVLGRYLRHGPIPFVRAMTREMNEQLPSTNDQRS